MKSGARASIGLGKMGSVLAEALLSADRTLGLRIAAGGPGGGGSRARAFRFPGTLSITQRPAIDMAQDH